MACSASLSATASFRAWRWCFWQLAFRASLLAAASTRVSMPAGLQSLGDRFDLTFGFRFKQSMENGDRFVFTFGFGFNQKVNLPAGLRASVLALTSSSWPAEPQFWHRFRHRWRRISWCTYPRVYLVKNVGLSGLIATMYVQAQVPAPLCGDAVPKVGYSVAGVVAKAVFWRDDLGHCIREVHA